LVRNAPEAYACARKRWIESVTDAWSAENATPIAV
jgi:hypothetical protein